MTRTFRVAASAALVIMFCVGCEWDAVDPTPDPVGTPEEQWRILMSRPAIEDAERTIKTAMNEMHDVLGAEFGIELWVQHPSAPPTGWSGCGWDFADVDSRSAASLYVNGWSARRPVGQDRWSDFVRRFGEIAGRYGFRLAHAGEGTGGRTVTASNGLDQIEYGGAAAGYLSGRVGCHLLAAAKTAGPPMPAHPTR